MSTSYRRGTPHPVTEECISPEDLPVAKRGEERGRTWAVGAAAGVDATGCQSACASGGASEPRFARTRVGARLRGRELLPQAAVAAGLALLTFLLYLPTVAPTVTVRNGGGDSGELVRAAWVLGVPHPTGYPLWIMLAHAFTALPAGEPAHRVALLSAAAAAGAVAFVFLAAAELLCCAGVKPDQPLRLLGPLAGALLLAASPLFWQQATIPETYALDACLEACGLWLLLRWQRGGAPLGAVAVVVGLALSNHLASLGLAAAVGVAVLLRGRPAAARLALALTPALLLPLAAYGWLLLRARSAPLANWGDPATLAALWQHVTAGEYHHFLTSRGLRELLLEAARWPGRLREQFTVVGAVAAVWSLGLALTRAPRAALPLLVVLLANLALVTRDAAPTAPTYLHISYLVLAVALGAGLTLIPAALTGSERVGRRAGALAAGAALLLAGWLGWQTRPAVDLSGDFTLERQAEAALAAVPPGGVLLTEGDNPLFALWYLQDVRSERPDVLIWSLNLALDPWYAPQMQQRAPDRVPAGLPADEDAAMTRLVAVNLPTRPVLSVAASPTLAARYALAPAGPLWRVVGPKG